MESKLEIEKTKPIGDGGLKPISTATLDDLKVLLTGIQIEMAEQLLDKMDDMIERIEDLKNSIDVTFEKLFELELDRNGT